MTLVVIKAVGLVTVQDLGRPGRMHEALPRGGALVPSLLVRANRSAGNVDGAAAIEVCGQLVVRASARCLVASDRAQRVLEIGEELALASDVSRATYLAIAGGIDAAVILGGRGAHLSAGLGALLRAGDRIESAHAPPAGAARPEPISRELTARELTAREPAAHEPTAREPTAREPTAHEPTAREPTAREIRVIPGPDLDAFEPHALDQLTRIAWRVSATSNRTGTRLEGPGLARRAYHVEESRPMVLGAIEVPRDGAPIVLGPEHPTTGGYPLIAVIATASLDAFHAIPLGGRVRFRV